jgi:hypothetical protein
MLQILVLGLGLSFAVQQNAPIQHVRSSEPWILALINAGLARSATFRQLVDTLNESDVIVYIETQATRESRQVHRESLDAYLIHHVVDQGGHRYLRIGLGARGAEKRLISILAHELQHAVESHGHRRSGTTGNSRISLVERRCLSIVLGCAMKRRLPRIFSAGSARS